MENEKVLTTENPLGVVPENELLRKFAIPSIIAMLVGSLYNIVDQFFIGQAIGELGNAATNIAFPFTTAYISFALMFGIGGASAFNLAMGEGKPEKAKHYIATSVTMMLSIGLALSVITLLFLKPLLIAFGSPETVLPYATTYTRIIALGFPAAVLAAGGAHTLRADGSPNMTMIVNIIGAVVNTVLDALFVFGFRWGMAGAAWATIIGQYVSAAIVLFYLPHFKTVKLDRAAFMPSFQSIRRIASLGTASFVNQISFLVVQIIMNNSLRIYGGRSEYGESIPIAVAGIAMKVFQVAGAFVIGISQGLQPIASFNYGAKKYTRVKRAYLSAIKSAAIICVISFLLFQFFPRQILSIFGEGSEQYFDFGVRFIRIFLFGIVLFFNQPITSNFFTSIGKPQKGVFLSLTRQVLFFIPLVLILPLFFGIDGITYTGPAADITAFIVSGIMIIHELRKPNYANTTSN